MEYSRCRVQRVILNSIGTGPDRAACSMRRTILTTVHEQGEFISDSTQGRCCRFFFGHLLPLREWCSCSPSSAVDWILGNYTAAEECRCACSPRSGVDDRYGAGRGQGGWSMPPQEPGLAWQHSNCCITVHLPGVITAELSYHTVHQILRG